MSEFISLEDIGCICHERTKIWNEAHGDNSLPEWVDSSEEMKDSVLDGVQFILRNYPNIYPSSLHDNWMSFRKSQGWVYGLEKNEEKKTHPCLLPFSSLPGWVQMKDTIFLNTVIEMMCLKK